MKLIFIRHAQTEWNALNKVQGRTNVPLNDVGRAQARAAAGKLKQSEEKVDIIFCSPLARAIETAQIVSQPFNAPVVIDKRLIEIDFGKWEGAGRKQFVGGSASNAILHTPSDILLENNVEPLDLFQKRINEFLEEIKEKYSGKTVVAVSHCVVGRWVHWYFHGLSGNEKYTLENAGIAEYVMDALPV
ncbi:MAG: histidine phosphatase family protein [Clostridiales bacterium]|jgi:broad specificity phosphatase PhoE|nr:histidine phosphatase family protein [Clostridiales bacterium]